MENNNDKGGKKILSLNKPRADKPRIDKTLKADHIVVTLTPTPEVSEKFRLSIETVSPDKNILMPAHTPIVKATKTSKNALTPSEKRAKKEKMILQLAKYSSMESGGSVKDFQKVYSSWDDLEVEEFLKSGRFDKYIQQNEDAEVIGSADAHAILRGQKQYREADLARIQSERETLQKLTGALVNDGSQRDDLYVTSETLITGKIYAQGLGGEFMGLMARHGEWKGMGDERRKQAFTKEERAIFGNIEALGLDPRLLTGEYAGDVLNTLEETDLTPIEGDLGDRKNPRRQLANIFGHFRRDVKMEEEGREHALTSHKMDIMPLNPLSNEDFYEREFTLGSVTPDLPEYMQHTINVNEGKNFKKFKSTDPFQQQLNVLGLSSFSNEADFFKVLATRYIDPMQLEELGDKKDQVIEGMAGIIGTKMREGIKQIAVSNAMIMQNNADAFKKLVDEVGIEKARDTFQPIEPTPYHAAYPSFEDFEDSAFNKYLVQDRLNKKGLYAGSDNDADLMSTLIGKGTSTIPYNKFDEMDLEDKESLIVRGALTTIPKLVAKTYGYGDAVVFGGIDRRSWEGGMMPHRLIGDDDTKSDDDRHRELLLKIENNEPLDKFDRDFMSRFVNMYFQPKGDLSPDWVDPNNTQIDEYYEFAMEEIQTALTERVEEEEEEEPTSGTKEGGTDVVASGNSTPAYEGDNPLDTLNEREQKVDHSGSGGAPDVNLPATQGHTDTSGTNKSASNSAQFVLGDFIRQASSAINMGREVARREASEGSRTGPTPKNREERLAAAKEDFLRKNPFVKVDEAKQGSEAWLKARESLPTASEAWRFTAGDSKANQYIEQKAREGWGLQARFEGNADTARGTALEDKLRKSYESQTDTEVLELGLLTNSLFPGGASLDGIVTKDGKATNKGVEFKAPREFGNPNKYRDQMQMQMAISGLEEIDLVQGVEINRKLQTKVHNFKADKQWQEENKDTIQEVKDALSKVKGMTQEEFLAANAEMAKDKSNKYPYLFRSKEAIETDKLTDKKAAEKKDPNAWRKGGVAADPTDAPYRPATVSGSGGGGKGGGSGVGGMAGALAGNPYVQAAKAVMGAIDTVGETAYDFSQDWIGPALDAGMNPGNYLANTLGMKGQGLTEKQARNATTTLSNAYGDMQMGDFNAANQMVRDSLGYMDYDDIEEYAQDPAGFLKEMDDRTSDLSPEAKASLYRKMNMEGAARLTSPELNKLVVDSMPRGDEEGYKNTLAASSAYHTGTRNMADVGLSAGIAGLTEAMKKININTVIELKANGVSLIATDNNGKQVVKEFTFGQTETK